MGNITEQWNIVFKTTEDARQYAMEPVETEERLLFPNYLGRVVRTFHFGAIPPYVEPQWILAVALNSIEEYHVLKVEKTETLLHWGVWP